MRLATLAKYRRLVYAEGSEPTLQTLRRRINQIPGGRVELGRYFVDLDVNERAQSAARDAQLRLAEILNDPLIKAMNREHSNGATAKSRKYYGNERGGLE
jgi:hypothetical protein